MTIPEPATARRSGDRLSKLIWQMALAPGGRWPMPTIERVNNIKILVELWLAEDQGGAPDGE
ncbi:hypothetical protein [Devosia riboflavina]